jgi:hypothetical protein
MRPPKHPPAYTPGANALGAAYSARTCLHCGAPADAVLPGQEAVWEAFTRVSPDGSIRQGQKLVRIAIRDLNFCHAHNPAARRRRAC